MKHLIYPCIWFNGDAKEATDFYCAAFPDTEIKISTPMVVTFQIKGKTFMALNGGADHRPNPSISFFNTCESAEEVDRAWAVLLEGGKVLMPIDSYPWSGKYGWIEDRYGVSWQLSTGSPDVQQAAALFPSLMFTNEQNGKAEKAINFYCSLFENSSIEFISRYEVAEHDIPGHIKFAQFKIDGYRMSAMDSSGPHQFTFDEGLSLVISCDTQEEIDFFWLNLTEGGKEGRCGWCQDAFGVWWQIVPAVLGALMSDSRKAPKVAEAFMKMSKSDLATLLKAAE